MSRDFDLGARILTGARVQVGARPTEAARALAAEDLRVLERIATAGPTDEVAAENATIKRLELAGFAAVVWTIDGRGWLQATVTPQGVTALHLVNTARGKDRKEHPWH